MLRFSLLYKYNLILTSILFLFFLIFNSNYTFLSLVLTVFGAISSAVILCILLYVLLFLFSFVGSFGLYFTGISFLIVDIVLIVDFFIFRLYGFHINAMVLNILTSPSANDSIQLGIIPFISLLSFILFLLLIEIFIIKKLLNTNINKLRDSNKFFNKILILPLFLVILTEKISYGFASLFSKNDILTTFRVIPLYQPLTFNKIATKYFGFKVKKEQQNNISLNSNLNYPKNKLISKSNINKVNIFIIASDAVKSSIIDKEVSPNIEKFKKDSLVFTNHYSGGNSTRFGIFSLLYGLNSTYWFSFLNNQKQTILFDYLNDLNYDINIISSTNASWPEFRKTAYVNIQDKLFDKFDGKPWEKDKKSSEKLFDVISKMDVNKPQFSFLFMDSPHGYSYPDEFEKFKVVNKDINYLTIEKDSENLDDVINTYKNSIFYNDMIFGKIIKKLKEKGLYENSIIIFTSDHGKEFFEYGAFGHNSSFSEAQTKVPFIMKIPNIKHNIVDKMTSHIDLVPTLLSYIGVKNKTSDYSNGFNLLDKNFNRNNVFISNWNNNAITTKDYTYVFSNLPNKMFKNEIRKNDNYKSIKNGHKIESSLLLSIMNQNREFFK